jgi:putative endonuclease
MTASETRRRATYRRYSAAGGEIDLIVRRGGTIVFVEVKARAALADAQVAIDGHKRRRFSRAVRVWLSRHPPPANATLRADAVFVARRAWPVHLVDAFPIETG